MKRLVRDPLQAEPKSKLPVRVDRRSTQNSHTLLDPIIVHEHARPSCFDGDTIHGKSLAQTKGKPLGLRTHLEAK